MARLITSRLRIEGTLKALTALHVGGMGDDPYTDLPLARDGRGRLYIPGTALAGPLRAWMEAHLAHFDKPLIDALWGYQPGKGSQSEGWASHVLVEDACLSEGISEELRDGVGIDRQWGTAAENLKYDRAVLPAGSCIPLQMIVELPPQAVRDVTPEQMRTAIGYLLNALQAEDEGLTLGAAETRGLGRVKLECLRVHEEDWSSRQGVLDFLKDKTKHIEPNSLLKADEELKPQPSERLTLSIEWCPCGPLMSRAGYDGLAVDALPLVSRVDGGKLALVLLGSSIKGALRNYAERIVRTVLKRFDDTWSEGRDRHRKQIKLPLISELFGTTERRGALAVVDCYAVNNLLDLKQWIGLTDNQNNVTFLQQAFHVAVDRWTGGAAEGLLFSGLEPFGMQWKPIRIDVNLARLKDTNQNAAVVLLLLLLRDLKEKRLPFGFGVNRGYGSLEVTKIKLDYGAGVDSALCELAKSDSILDHLGVLPEKLKQAWVEWIKKEGEHA